MADRNLPSSAKIDDMDTNAQSALGEETAGAGEAVETHQDTTHVVPQPTSINDDQAPSIYVANPSLTATSPLAVAAAATPAPFASSEVQTVQLSSNNAPPTRAGLTNPPLPTIGDSDSEAEDVRRRVDQYEAFTAPPSRLSMLPPVDPILSEPRRHDTYIIKKVHTIVCDVCHKKNKAGALFQCTSCIQQICTECIEAKCENLSEPFDFVGGRHESFRAAYLDKKTKGIKGDYEGLGVKMITQQFAPRRSRARKADTNADPDETEDELADDEASPTTFALPSAPTDRLGLLASAAVARPIDEPALNDFGLSRLPRTGWFTTAASSSAGLPRGGHTREEINDPAWNALLQVADAALQELNAAERSEARRNENMDQGYMGDVDMGGEDDPDATEVEPDSDDTIVVDQTEDEVGQGLA